MPRPRRFTACQQPNYDRGIYIPRPYKIFLDRKLASYGNGSHMPWSRKKPVALFRGALSTHSRLALLRHSNGPRRAE